MQRLNIIFGCYILVPLERPTCVGYAFQQCNGKTITFIIALLQHLRNDSQARFVIINNENTQAGWSETLPGTVPASSNTVSIPILHVYLQPDQDEAQTS
jgi:hypothetical protein